MKSETLWYVLFAFCIFVPGLNLKSQTVSQGPKCTLKGIVWDSVHNYRVPAATVVASKDSFLLSFAITDEFGGFTLNNLPQNENLTLAVSSSGYRDYRSKIETKGGELNLGRITLMSYREYDDTVVVKSMIPVRWNKDTLEFNADAFKLQPNAVIEDLFNAIPNIVIWGDGLITVNGRPVKKIFIDKKEFFGNNPAIALKNLPKTNVEKLQVFSAAPDAYNIDSSMLINVQLKPGKRQGFFGKLSGGIGNQESISADYMAGLYNPKTQFGLAGTYNNINKRASSVESLIKVNSYKNDGMDIDFLPNLLIDGKNTYNIIGALFNHDLNDIAYNRSQLNATLLYENAKQDLKRESEIIAIADNNGDEQQAFFSVNSLRKQDNLNFKANVGDTKKFIRVGSTITNSNDLNLTKSHSVKNADIINSSSSNNNLAMKRTSLNLEAGYEWKLSERSHLRTNYFLNSNYLANDDNTEINFESAANTFNIKRNSIKNQESLNHKLILESPIFINFNNRFLNSISIVLKNISDFENGSVNSNVNNITGGSTIPYMPLTFDDKTYFLRNTPSLNFSKRLEKYLPGRLNRGLLINISLQGDYFNWENKAQL